MDTSKKVRRFEAEVTSGEHEECFPVFAYDYLAAKAMALSYVIQVLRLTEFELRIVGS